jgi:hypothetical protein
MASPLGNRKNAKFMAVSTAPSINKTPMGSSTPPVPYPVCHNLSNSVGVVPHVKLNSDPAYVLDQTTQSRCTGDEPGTAKGVKSGTVSGEVKPTSASGHVKITKKRVVRVGDTCTLNAGNCPGVYVAGPASAAPGASANPPIKPETPAEKTFLEKLGLWWEETKTQLGEAAAHPLEATKGAVKDTLNIVPQLGQLLMQGSTLQSAGEIEQAAAMQSALGNREAASQLHSTAEGVRQSADQIQLPQFEMSNPAQEGGAKIAMAAQLATGVAGLAKGGAKLGARGMAKLGTKAGALEKAALKEGAALTKEAAAVEKGAGEVAAAGKVGKTGDGFHVKGQGREMLSKEEKIERFETSNTVDMTRLSSDQTEAAKILRRQGRDAAESKQILSSGRDFEVVKLQEGDKLYGFTTEGHPKAKASAYWLDEAGYKQIKSQHFHDGKWNNEGVKQSLALPCYNKANSLVSADVIREHEAVRSTVGEATELVRSGDRLFVRDMLGGGNQVTPAPNGISEVTILRLFP